MSVKTVWVVTREVNDYNQHGDYFDKIIFAKKPTVIQLAEAFKKMKIEPYFNDFTSTLIFFGKLAEGGGRQDSEDTWYYLEEVELL